MMKRFARPTIVLLTAVLSVFGMAAASSNPRPLAQAGEATVPLDAATLIIEVSATDGDAGIQVFLDAEPWREITVSSPDGRVMLAVDAEGRLKGFGLTELFSESNEPPFDVFPLEKLKRLFPEGVYTFNGTTIDGKRLVGQATLSHDIPEGPEIISPADGAVVARNNVVARWKSVSEPPGIDIVGYRVIVEREHPLRVFSVDLPASANSVRVPLAFLESDTEYELEIQAIEASGNQTFTNIHFLVS